MTDTQDRHLLHAIKLAMGSHYDNGKACVYNIEKLVNKYDDLVEKSEFKSPKKHYKDQINGRNIDKK